jgi:hypothetical protein
MNTCKSLSKRTHLLSKRNRQRMKYKERMAQSLKMPLRTARTL